jgi:hypothetical protein
MLAHELMLVACLAIQSAAYGGQFSFTIGDDDAFGGLQTDSCGPTCDVGETFNADPLLITLLGGSPSGGRSTPTYINEAGMDQLTKEDEFIFEFSIPYALSGQLPTSARVAFLVGGLGTSGPSNDLSSGTGFGQVPLVAVRGPQLLNFGPFFPHFVGFDVTAENIVRVLEFDVTSIIENTTAGTVTLTLDGDGANTNDRLAFDYVRLNIETIPEPSTFLVLFQCLLGCCVGQRKICFNHHDRGG